MAKELAILSPPSWAILLSVGLSELQFFFRFLLIAWNLKTGMWRLVSFTG
jgi:hypothetical protein